MAAFSSFAGQRPLSSLARQASVKVALQSMSAFVRVMIKAGSSLFIPPHCVRMPLNSQAAHSFVRVRGRGPTNGEAIHCLDKTRHGFPRMTVDRAILKRAIPRRAIPRRAVLNLDCSAIPLRRDCAGPICCGWRSADASRMNRSLGTRFPRRRPRLCHHRLTFQPAARRSRPSPREIPRIGCWLPC